jgi:hypothetical protein
MYNYIMLGGAAALVVCGAAKLLLEGDLETVVVKVSAIAGISGLFSGFMGKMPYLMGKEEIDAIRAKNYKKEG